MNKMKGTKDYRDLDNESQFYYEKLVQMFNDKLDVTDCVNSIIFLDNLIDAIRRDDKNDNCNYNN